MRTRKAQRVQDDGPGIPGYAEDQEFEKFYSLAWPDSRKKSTGFGLPFEKQSAELHPGRVTLKNATKKSVVSGAVATISLSLGDVAA